MIPAAALLAQASAVDTGERIAVAGFSVVFLLGVTAFLARLQFGTLARADERLRRCEEDRETHGRELSELRGMAIGVLYAATVQGITVPGLEELVVRLTRPPTREVPHP